MELSNLTILITGGSSGLGFCFAQQLVALGNTVIITGRDAGRLARAKERLPAVHAIQSDVSDLPQITRLSAEISARFPDLNLLINNAGEMRSMLLQDPALDISAMTRELDTNLVGPIRMVQQFLPQLKSRKSAAILQVTSGVALAPFPISPVYSASKAGLRAFTQSLRVQLKSTGIKVFELIAPAARTPLNDQFLHTEGFNPKLLVAPEKIVAAALTGLRQDHYEIYPGPAKAIRLLARLAPAFLLRQMSKVGANLFQHPLSSNP